MNDLIGYSKCYVQSRTGYTKCTNYLLYGGDPGGSGPRSLTSQVVGAGPGSPIFLSFPPSSALKEPADVPIPLPLFGEGLYLGAQSCTLWSPWARPHYRVLVLCATIGLLLRNPTSTISKATSRWGLIMCSAVSQLSWLTC